jgi:hypothetical protein
MYIIIHCSKLEESNFLFRQKSKKISKFKLTKELIKESAILAQIGRYQFILFLDVSLTWYMVFCHDFGLERMLDSCSFEQYVKFCPFYLEM